MNDKAEDGCFPWMLNRIEALLCKGTFGILLARYIDMIGSTERAHGYSMNLSYQRKWITKEQLKKKSSVSREDIVVLISLWP